MDIFSDPAFGKLSPSTQGFLVFVGTCSVALVVILVTRFVRGVLKIVTSVSAALGGSPLFKSIKQELKKPLKGQKEFQSQPVSDEEQEHSLPGVSLKKLVKDQRSKAKGSSSGAADKRSHHALFITTIKGHGDAVCGVAISADGSALATACEDRALRVFKLTDGVASGNLGFRRKNLTSGLVDVAFGEDSAHVAALTKGTLDAASLCMFGPASNGGKNNQALEQLWEVSQLHGKHAGLCLHSGVAAAGTPVLLSCSLKGDMRVVDGRNGRQLAEIDTNGLQNHGAAISPDGRMAAAATFTADVKVHEILFDKSGTYSGCRKVMDLKAHKSQVLAVSFSPDAKRMVTASKDGTWRVWNIDVRYQQQEDPKCLRTEKLPLPNGRCFHLMAYGPEGVVAAADGGSLFFLDANTGDVVDVVEDAHEARITSMQWSRVPLTIADKDRSYVLATASLDRKVRLWRCPSP